MQKVYRSSSRIRIGGTIVFLLVLAVFFAMFFDFPHTTWGHVGLGALCAFLGLGMAAIWLMRVVVGGDGIIVHRLFGVERIAWDDVQGAEVVPGTGRNASPQVAVRHTRGLGNGATPHSLLLGPLDAPAEEVVDLIEQFHRRYAEPPMLAPAAPAEQRWYQPGDDVPDLQPVVLPEQAEFSTFPPSRD